MMPHDQTVNAPPFSRATKRWFCIVTFIALSCMVLVPSCGDDDDDAPAVVCDYGQGTLQNGELRTPIQVCVLGGSDVRSCTRDNEQREIEWVCACRDETACKLTKEFFKRIHDAARNP